MNADVGKYLPNASPTFKLSLGIQRGRYRIEEGVLEKRCSRCKDYWPADLEFFYRAHKGDGLHTYCKACYVEVRFPSGRPSHAAVA